MKNVLLIAIALVIAIYAYVAINEKQKERILAKRVPAIKKVNKYEFSRALYQIREVHKASTLRNEVPKRERQENVVKEESNPAQPIEDNQEVNQDEPIRYPVGVRLPRRFTPSEDQEQEQQDINQEQQPIEEAPPQ